MKKHAPQTERLRLRFVETQRVNATPEEVFGLLCPVREFDWIPAWDCNVIYTESGLAEIGCVFQTDRPSDGGLDTWVVSRYEPPQRISFVRVNPLRTMIYDIELTSEDDGTTTLEWVQQITALSAAGDRHLEEMKAEDFSAMIRGAERLLKHYLEHGEALVEDRRI